MSKKSRARKTVKQETPVASRNVTRNWILAIILSVTFLAFANTIFSGFAYDDTTQILQNEVIRSFSNIPIAFTKEVWFWRALQDKDPNKETGPTTPYYRPIFTLYLMIGWDIFETWAAGWHIANILMHLLAVYFAFLILERITKDLRLAAIASLLFAVHPLRTESVAWISGVTDLFLALFLLPSFYLYMLYRESGKAKHLAGSLALFMLAAFSKEPAVALPLFILAYELFIINQEKRLLERIKPAIIYCVAFLCVSAAYFAMRFYALGFVLGDAKYAEYAQHHVLLTIPLVICKYVGLLFAGFIALPLDLLNLIGIPVMSVNFSIFHETPMVKDPLSLRFILPALIVAALALAMWPLRKTIISRFAILWFAMHLLPVLNLNAFAEEFLVQERYVYISSIGFSLLIAQGLVRLPVEAWLAMGSRRTVQATVVVVIVVLLAGKTLAQNTMWKDDMTVWTTGAELASDQPMPHYILGHKYISQGLKIRDPRLFEQAIQQLEQYLELDPDNQVVINNLAASYLTLYQYQAALNPATADRAKLDRIIALCEKGIAMGGETATLYDTLGVVHTFETERKDYYRALRCFDIGLSQKPDHPGIIFHKGVILVNMKQVDMGLGYLERARQLSPQLPDVYKAMANAYQRKGQVQEAINYYSEYLRLDPNAIDAGAINETVNNLRALLEKQSPQGG